MQGRELFLHEWQPIDLASGTRDPLVAPQGDGLGPVFNAKACAACHFQAGVGGAGPGKQNVMAFDVVPTRTNPKFHAGVVHASAVAEPNRECPSEINRLFPVVQGEQRKVGGCVVTVPEFNPVSFTSMNTPALFGSGAIDRLSDGAIRGHQRQRQRAIYPREIRGDFSATPAGRVRVLADGRIGRFGWKAQFATLEEFVASACAVEIGLSNPRRRQDRPHQQGEDREAPFDLSGDQVLSLTAYTGSLPQPIRVLPEESGARNEIERGEMLFTKIGCADCHAPDLGGVAGIYSDLLLHKLEDDRDGGAYGRLNPDLPLPDDQPLPNEWRTPPLWGVADSAPYFHDGAAPTLEAAILRHGLQARHVTSRYRSLPASDQVAVIRFLETLRAPAAEPVPSSLTTLAANTP
jgi:CxxC motif-containing protein (DUF1111 family)